MSCLFQLVGISLALGGILLSMTGIGLIVGIPMFIIGALLTGVGRSIAAKNAIAQGIREGLQK